MSARNLSRLAWSVCALALALFALTLVLVFLGRSTPLPQGWVPWQVQAIYSVGFIGAPVLGGLIASRRPRNPYGWLWLGNGLGFSLLSFARAYEAYALVAEPGSLPAPRTAAMVLGNSGWALFLTVLPLLLLLFPDGRPPSRRWRFVVWVVASAGAVVLVLGPFLPDESLAAPVENPLGVGGAVGEAIFVVDQVGVYVLFGCVLLSALSLVFRFRRAGEVQRQQLKWFAFAAVLNGGLIIFLGFLGQELPGLWGTLFETATLAGLYVAVGVAILRHRLYDIDVIINRTLVYGALTAMLVLLYFGGVAATQTTFRLLTGQERLPQLAVVASTLAIAALFNPLRRRVQGFIDRLFYRRKYDAAKTLEGFGATLRDATDLDELNAELLSVVRGTMQPAHASLWLRSSPNPMERARTEEADR